MDKRRGDESTGGGQVTGHSEGHAGGASLVIPGTGGSRAVLLRTSRKSLVYRAFYGRDPYMSSLKPWV